MISILYDKFIDRWIYLQWIKEETMVIERKLNTVMCYN